MQKAKFKITGMYCGGCQHYVEKLLTIDGVKERSVDHRSGEATASFDEKKITLQDIISLIDRSKTYRVSESVLLK